jgi:hypothetical protein
MLRDWLKRKHGGNRFLQGLEAETWDETHDHDLTSLTAHFRDKDVLSKFIDDRLIPWYHDKVGNRIKVCITTLSYRSNYVNMI